MSTQESAMVELSADAASDPSANCRVLESGKVLYFPRIPFAILPEDREFLLGQVQTSSRFHKNISYRPLTGVLKGIANDSPDRGRMKQVMQKFTDEVVAFTGKVLAPYKGKMNLDYASFRPLEEESRDLPLHRRNDLLHVDAFPTRPTHGGRILRVFANINPAEDRVWNVGQPFHVFMPELGKGVAPPFRGPLMRGVIKAAASIGLPVADRSPYDEYMHFLHDWMKEQAGYQKNASQQQISFTPGSAWMVYTDGVPHAVLHGRY